GGVTFLILELLVIPGFGVAGITGIGLMLWGLYKMLLGEYPTPDQIERAFLGLNIGFVGGALGTIMLIRVFIGSKFFERNVPNQSEDYSITTATGIESLVGQVGITLTELMPTGKAEFGDRQINVHSRGEYLPRGTQVTLLEVQGNTGIVCSVADENEEIQE
ncbi:NfeD family protein, partial [Candidatus Neomarinimicrobiota bacterium]